jgi:hypothetical protein
MKALRDTMYDVLVAVCPDEFLDRLNEMKTVYFAYV